jgi:dihydrofolate synthase/folylpolyglutamate synthase
MKMVNESSPVTPTLHNIRHLYELMGLPLSNTPVIHVGGTNGKGSTSFKIANALRKSGLKTGIFVSPHISSFRERLQINGELLSEEDVCTIVPPILEMCRKHEIDATFFDLTTMMSFMKFQREACDVVVLEVGLGGELDSTNVLTETSLSIITSIQLDHVRTLGSTIEEIATKKAGIMKHGVPVLIGPGTPVHLLKETARRRGSPSFELSSFSPLFSSSERDVEYVGDVDVLNQEIAHSALEIMKRELSKGRTRTSNSILAAAQHKVADALCLMDPATTKRSLAARPPCRFEEFLVAHPTTPVRVVLDVAHNQDAIDALVIKILRQHHYQEGANNSPPLNVVVVLAMSRDKMAADVVKSLLSLVDGDAARIICVDASATTSRALPAAHLRELVNSSSANNYNNNATTMSRDVDVHEAIEAAITLSRERAEATGGVAAGGAPPMVLVTGSGFIMSDARQCLGIVEPRD